MSARLVARGGLMSDSAPGARSSGSQRHLLEVPSLVAALDQALRSEILSGQIAPGEAVTEIGVAERFSVARPTAKAAVERLVYDGLLERSINKTARAPVLGIDDIEDLYQARMFLERELAQALAARRAAPEAARRRIRDLQEMSADSDLSGVLEADVGFHRALLEALGSPRFGRLYESLLGEAHLCMAQVQLHHLLHPEVIAVEHIEILDAIGSGDEARAREAATRHLEHARQRLVTHLQNGPGEDTQIGSDSGFNAS
jgi:DNA-binding GntR family transcriptional regulator